MRSHNHTQQNRPSKERPDPPPVLFLIKQHTDRHAPKNLGDPINRIVQRSPLDVKQHGGVVAKLPGVKVIAGEEHGEEEDDKRVGSEGDPETFEFGFP